MGGLPSGLGDLVGDLIDPPLEITGALQIHTFISAKESSALAASLNTLIASPTFAAWRDAAPLDVESWFRKVPTTNKIPAVILSVAHLEDEERAMVLGVVLDEVLNWVRGIPGSKHLKAQLMIDEVFGFVPPHPKTRPPNNRS